MYKRLVTEVGSDALALIETVGTDDVPPMLRSAVKMGLELIKRKLAGLSEEAAEKIVTGAIEALEKLKQRIADERASKEG